MSFPINDKYWVNTLDFVQKNIKYGNKIVAPDEFEEKFTGFLSYRSIIDNSFNNFQWVIIHKGMMDNLKYAFLEKVVNECIIVFANEVFVIFTNHTSMVALNHNFIHLQSFWEKIKTLKNLNTARTTNKQQPNLNFLNERLLFTADAVRFNIKTLGYEYARSLREQLTIPSNLSPQKINLQSKACQQNDIESDWFFYWCQEMKTPVVYHRKLWEFCYILQALYEYDLLTPGRKGLGFGCGEEPLPSILAAYDIEITATDLDPTASAAQGWIETKQNMSSVEKILHPELCTKELFTKNVSLKYVDMNAIPAYLEGKYDFCWSACALEHLGSIKNGLLFIENSLKTLVPGGISIQTTEFNYLEEQETIDNYGTVLFRKKDFEGIAKKLTAAGHQVAPLDFNIGSRVLDRFIDLPPYNSKVHEFAQEAHLRLLIDGFASTSFGMIIRKAV